MFGGSRLRLPRELQLSPAQVGLLLGTPVLHDRHGALSSAAGQERRVTGGGATNYTVELASTQADQPPSGLVHDVKNDGYRLVASRAQVSAITSLALLMAYVPCAITEDSHVGDIGCES